MPTGFPETVEELVSVVRETFRISEDFFIHYKDADFGDNFFSLVSTSVLQNKDTVKIAYIQEPTVTLTLTDMDTPFTIVEGPPQTSYDTSSSTSSHDTIPVSPGSVTESPTQWLKAWPEEFPIPRFSSSTELLLQSGNEQFSSSGTLFGTEELISLLPDILGNLAEAIFE